MGKYLVFFILFTLGACGGGSGSSDSKTTDTSNTNTASETEAKAGYLALDNMGRTVSKEFEGYTLTVVSDRELKDNEQTSKDTIAVYGEINQKNTGALLKINSHYRNTDKIQVKIYQQKQLLSTHDAVVESDNIRFFGEIKTIREKQ